MTDKDWLNYMAMNEIPSGNGIGYILLPVLAREILKLRERVSSQRICPSLYSYDYDTDLCNPNLGILDPDYKIDR